jgi:hypothetical protein
MHKFINGRWHKVAEPPKIEYLTKSDLMKKREWSEKMISIFYPVPDKELENRIHNSLFPIKLYRLDIVKNIENSDEFLLYRNNNQKRRDGAEKAKKTKRKKLISSVESIDIVIPILDKQKLIVQAIDYFNRRQKHRNSIFFAYPNSDPSLIKTITKNYIRHEMTDYPQHLSDIYGQVGRTKAFIILKHKFNESIIKQYPWLE